MKIQILFECPKAKMGQILRVKKETDGGFITDSGFIPYNMAVEYINPPCNIKYSTLDMRDQMNGIETGIKNLIQIADDLENDTLKKKAEKCLDTFFDMKNFVKRNYIY